MPSRTISPGLLPIHNYPHQERSYTSQSIAAQQYSSFDWGFDLPSVVHPRPITIAHLLNTKPACSDTSLCISKCFIDIISKAQDIESDIVAYIIDNTVIDIDSKTDDPQWGIDIDEVLPSQSRIRPQRIMGVFRRGPIESNQRVILDDEPDAHSHEYFDEVLPSQSRIRPQRIMGVFRRGPIESNNSMFLTDESDAYDEDGDA